MARINTYPPDVILSDEDLILGSDYQGEINGIKKYETKSFRLFDIANYLSQYVYIHGDKYDLEQIEVNADRFNALAGSIGTIDEFGALTTISTNFSNDVFSTVSSVASNTANLIAASITSIPSDVANNVISSVTQINQQFADGIFEIATITEDFANQILGTSTSVAYATADQFDALSLIVNGNVTSIGTLSGQITTLETTVSDNITTTAGQISFLGTRIDTTDAQVTTLQSDLTLLTSTVDTNTGSIATNATNITSLGTVIDTANADIATLQTNFTNLSSTVDGNTGDIAANATQIGLLSTSIDTANVNIAALDLELTTLSSTVDGNTGDIAANATALDLLTTRVTTSEADITALDLSLTTLTTTVDGQTGDIAANAASIQTLQTSVTTAEANITNLQTDVTTLDTAVTNNGTNIATNATNITALGTRVDTAEADVTAIQGTLTTLSATVDTNTGDITANATALDTLATTVSTQGTDITNLSTNITNLTTTVDGNTGAISTNATNISNLSTTVTNNFTTLDAAITAVDTARIDGDTALTNSITTLTATVDGNTAAVQTNATAIATVDGKLTASYGITVDAQGRVAGLKLLADGTTGSEFIAKADTFAVDMPNDTRVLTVDANGLVINGSGNFTGDITGASGTFSGALNVNDKFLVSSAGAVQVYAGAGGTLGSGGRFEILDDSGNSKYRLYGGGINFNAWAGGSNLFNSTDALGGGSLFFSDVAQVYSGNGTTISSNHGFVINMTGGSRKMFINANELVMNPSSLAGSTHKTVINGDLEVTGNVTFSAGGDGNTTYDIKAVTTTGGAFLRLTGSNAVTDDVKFSGAGATTVSYVNDSTIQISSTDTNTQRTDEEIRDVIAPFIVGGTNIGVVHNDTANTLTISHLPVGSQASVNNSNGTVIQDVTLSGGHVTGLVSANLDLRYLQLTGGTVSGTITATDFIVASDQRLKNNISTYSPDSVNVRFREYVLNNDPSRKRVGVIAQELEQSHPEFVVTDPQTGMKAVSYVDMLVAKVAELEKRIKQLENGGA